MLFATAHESKVKKINGTAQMLASFNAEDSLHVELLVFTRSVRPELVFTRSVRSGFRSDFLHILECKS
jgi:hypothetical protein